MGALWSSCTISVSPLERTNRSNGISISAEVCAPAGAARTMRARAIGANRASLRFIGSNIPRGPELCHRPGGAVLRCFPPPPLAAEPLEIVPKRLPVGTVPLHLEGLLLREPPIHLPLVSLQGGGHCWSLGRGRLCRIAEPAGAFHQELRRAQLRQPEPDPLVGGSVEEAIVVRLHQPADHGPVLV